MNNIFDLNNISYQESISIKEKHLIVDFYNSYINYWKEDIIGFEEQYKKLDINNVTELIIWVSDYHEKKIEFSSYFLLNDNTKIYLNISTDDMINWLEKFNLISK